MIVEWRGSDVQGSQQNGSPCCVSLSGACLVKSQECIGMEIGARKRHFHSCILHASFFFFRSPAVPASPISQAMHVMYLNRSQALPSSGTANMQLVPRVKFLPAFIPLVVREVLNAQAHTISFIAVLAAASLIIVVSEGCCQQIQCSKIHKYKICMLQACQF
jgi:hypothetical protein